MTRPENKSGPLRGSSSEDQLSELLEEVLERIRKGEAVNLEVLAGGRPEIVRRLEELLPAMETLASLDASSGGRKGPGPEGIAAENVPAVLGDFRILREIGRGGMAIVYEAEQISLRRRVALKVLPFASVLDPRSLQRFLNEAQAAAKLHHTHIVPVFAVGCERGIHYYAMQYIDGRSLSFLIQELRTLCGAKESVDAASSSPPSSQEESTLKAFPHTLTHVQSSRSIHTLQYVKTVADIGRQAAEALDHAHAMGVVHRDIKPSNLLLDERGSIWIADFGLAQCKGQPGMTATGEIVGTLKYMSPEQAGGQRLLLDERTDIYSLAATLYELVTLRPVCQEQTPENILREVAEREPTLPRRHNEAIPIDLETILLKAMSKDPRDRYAGAKDMARDFQLFLEDRPIQARRPSILQHLVKWARRHRKAVGLGLAMVLLLSIAGPIVALRESSLRRMAENGQSAALAAASRETAERSRAEKERDAKVAALERSEGLRLAAHSSAALPTNPTLALLLAAEAGKHSTALPVQNALRLALDSQRELRTLTIQESPRRISFSRDGKLILTVEREARLWDGLTGAFLRVFPVEDYCWGAALSPDSRRVLTFDMTGTWRIWDAESGKEISRIRRIPKEGQRLEPHGPDPSGPCPFSPDGKRFIIPWDDASAAILDADTAKILIPLKGHEKEVRGAGYSPDGRRIVTWSSDQTVRIWDSKEGTPVALLDWLKSKVEAGALTGGGKPVLRIPDHVQFSPDSRKVMTSTSGRTNVWNIDPVELLYDLGAGSGRGAFSPDGRFVLGFMSGPQFAQVKVHDLITKKETATLRGHTDSISSASFSQSGSWVVTASEDRSARLWDLHSGKELASYVGHPAGLISAQLSPDDLRLVTSTRQSAHLWHTAKGARRSTILVGGSDAQEMVLSPDGKSIATQASPATTQVWDIDTGTLTLELPVDSERPRFSADGRWIYGPQPGNSAGIWEATTGKPVAKMDGHENRVISAMMTPGSDGMITTALDGSVLLWSVAGERRAGPIPSSRNSFSGSVLSRDGKLLGVPENDHVVALYEYPSLNKLGAFKGHTEELWSLSFSPDGRWLASVSRDSTIRIWRIPSGDLHCVIKTENWIRAPLFTPDSRRLLVLASSTGSARIELWDLEAGRREYEVQENSGRSWSIDLDSEGKRFLAGSNQDILIYETSTGKEVQRLRKMQASGDVRFLPDGRRILMFGMAGAAIVDLETGQRLGHRWADSGHVTFQDFSPDGKRVMLNIWHQSVALRDIETPRKTTLLTGHAWQIMDMAFSPDGKKLVTASLDQSAKVWDVATGRQLQLLGDHPYRVAFARFSSDGERIVTRTEDGAVLLWNALTGHRLAVWGSRSDPIDEVDFLPKTHQALAVHRKGHVLMLDEKASHPLPLTFNVISARTSHDGRRVLLQEGTRTTQPERPGMPEDIPPGVMVKRSDLVHVWDLQNHREIHLLKHDKPVQFMDFTRSGTQVLTQEASTYRENPSSWKIRLWDAASGAELHQTSGSGTTGTIYTSLDGQYMFIGAIVGNASSVGGRLFDLQKGLELATFPADISWSEASFTPDGKSFVTRSAEGEIRIHPLEVLSVALNSTPRELSADEMDRYEVGEPEERARRRTATALHPILQDLSAAVLFLQTDPAHASGIRLAISSLTQLRKSSALERAADKDLARIRNEVGRLRALSILDERMEKILAEIDSAVSRKSGN